MIDELMEWLKANKISHKKADADVVEVEGFGKLYCEDTDKLKSIFRPDAEGRMKFNSMENPTVLRKEGINHIAFKFGDNWFYFDTRQDFKLNLLKRIGKHTLREHPHRYVNLGVHTPYELLNGSFAVEEWVKKAKWLGHEAVGVCDKNTMASLLNLQKVCKAEGMGWVFGYTMDVTDGHDTVEAKVYCQTQEGLGNLLRIQKAINVDSEDRTISWEELLGRGKGNVLVMGKHSPEWLAGKTDIWFDRLHDSFDGCYYQLDLAEFKADRIDVRTLESARTYFNKIYDTGNLPPVLITDCYYLDRDDARNKIVLNKIASGAAHEQSDDQYFKDIDELWETTVPLFDPDKWDAEDIFAWACENTVKIAQGAKAAFETDRNFMPQYDMTEEEKRKYGDRHTMFLELLEEGFRRLVPPGQEERYRKQLEHEIYVLESTNNVDYMLVQYDTANWARANGILVGCGRGSAGGCLVLYLLGITLIDPIKYGLLFERFLLPERAGLYPATTTVIGKDIESTDFIELELENGRTYRMDKDARLVVKREGCEEPVEIYADELAEGDDILFDNRDELFTLNEI